ncbi:hypothetical protein EVAR_39074_1 [Eumeta japonica]|uniref:Uncharacterized protein n=1 Tax=Eumeta variegata TaxID=151549 RepID=A0A4C1WMP1_EUMVA|nr:hypothetical protein EVAR_39074_1 [Eumeta japonica]
MQIWMKDMQRSDHVEIYSLYLPFWEIGSFLFGSGFPTTLFYIEGLDLKQASLNQQRLRVVRERVSHFTTEKIFTELVLFQIEKLAPQLSPPRWFSAS